jgi:hypothetical protein
MNLSGISNYVKAKWSKGVSGVRTDVTTKDIRLLSCFGNGKDVKVCPALRPSEVKMGKFICGECGCGDKPSVFLNGDEQEYTKLDHPYLACPRTMPGFSNYSSSMNKDERKIQIDLLTEGIDAYIKKPELEVKKEEKKCTECEKNKLLLEEKSQEYILQGYSATEANQKANEFVLEEKKKSTGGCKGCQKKREMAEEAQKQANASGLKGHLLEEQAKEIYKKLMSGK